MIENINDLISLVVLTMIIFTFIFIALRHVLNSFEKQKLKKELEYYKRRRGD